MNDDHTPDLTLPDLVVLGLLDERPMHGYELNQELEYREVRDWAGISRPQVYYSLKKLARLGLLEEDEGAGSGAGRGPERRVYRPSAEGRAALARALARRDWAEQREIPPFLTWLALSSHAEPAGRAAVIEARRRFVSETLEKERATLVSVEADTGEMIPAAILMLKLVVRQLEVELIWLNEVVATLG